MGPMPCQGTMYDKKTVKRNGAQTKASKGSLILCTTPVQTTGMTSLQSEVGHTATYFGSHDATSNEGMPGKEHPVSLSSVLSQIHRGKYLAEEAYFPYRGCPHALFPRQKHINNKVVDA